MPSRARARAAALAAAVVAQGAAVAQAVFADLRLAPDRDHAPFLHGVASADPLPDSVLLWTRVTTDNETAAVRWALWDAEAAGQSFEAPLQGGLVEGLDADDDYTLTVTVDGLAPGHAYVYQFEAPEDGARSVLGKTLTASDASADNVTLAYTSCSSLWSGHFNHYRAIANDDSLELWVHLGDYIYPEITAYETHRVPKGLCEHKWFKGVADLQAQDASENDDPYIAAMVESLDCAGSELSLYRWLHALYLMDPDLRAARAAHPVIVSFDNHDLANTDNALEGARKAAFEWVPQRHVLLAPETPGDPPIVNTLRQFRLGGDIVDLIMLDTHSGRLANETGFLGESQHAWLSDVLADSASAGTAWRMFGQAKGFMPVSLNRAAEGLQLSFGIAFALACVLLATCVGSSLFMAHRRAESTLAIPDTKQEDGLAQADSDMDSGDSASSASRKCCPARCQECCSALGSTRLAKAHRAAPRSLRCCTVCGIVTVVVVVLLWIVATAVARSKFDTTEVNYLEDALLDEPRDTWDLYPEDREQFYATLEARGVASNNLMASGDLHMTIFADLIAFEQDDADSLVYYDAASYSGARYGGELLPTSGSRGNLNEQLARATGLGVGTPLNAAFTSFLDGVVQLCNPHFHYFNSQDHGYGTVVFTREQLLARVDHFPVLSVVSEPSASIQMRMRDGVDMWEAVE